MKHHYDEESGMLLSSWKDARAVYFLSTATGNPGGHSVKRWFNGARHTIPAPYGLYTYNFQMGPVDHTDQLRSYYSGALSRLRRWWLQILFYCLDLSFMNTRITFNEVQAAIAREARRAAPKPKNDFDFRVLLTKQLLASFEAEDRRKSSSRAFPNLGRHVCTLIDRDGAAHARELKCMHCVWCTHSGRRRKNTQYQCPICMVPLHHPMHSRKPEFRECFEAYHRASPAVIASILTRTREACGPCKTNDLKKI